MICGSHYFKTVVFFIQNHSFHQNWHALKTCSYVFAVGSDINQSCSCASTEDRLFHTLGHKSLLNRAFMSIFISIRWCICVAKLSGLVHAYEWQWQTVWWSMYSTSFYLIQYDVASLGALVTTTRSHLNKCHGTCRSGHSTCEITLVCHSLVLTVADICFQWNSIATVLTAVSGDLLQKNLLTCLNLMSKHAH